MSSRISHAGAIKRTGTTIENEPIIRSDEAASDVMVWQSSNGTDLIKVREDGSNNLLLGVGTGTPSAPLHISSSTTDNNLIIESTDGTNTTAPDLVLYRNSASAAW